MVVKFFPRWDDRTSHEVIQDFIKSKLRSVSMHVNRLNERKMLQFAMSQRTISDSQVPAKVPSLPPE